MAKKETIYAVIEAGEVVNMIVADAAHAEKIKPNHDDVVLVTDGVIAAHSSAAMGAKYDKTKGFGPKV